MNEMTIEQLIEEIEVYVDSAPGAGMLSGGNMVKVNREELLAMIEDLKERLPKEIDLSRDIVRNSEKRIENAKAEAERILEKAKTDAERLIDSNEVVEFANIRAQEIIDDAIAEAEDIIAEAQENRIMIQTGALQYTQNILEGLEQMYDHMVEQETNYFNAVLQTLTDTHKQIVDDKREIDVQLGGGFKTSRSKEDFEKKEED